MMEKNNKSTNNQQIDESQFIRELVILAITFVITIAIIIFIFKLPEQGIKDLEARCKSLGGVAGQTKCFKNGQEI